MKKGLLQANLEIPKRNVSNIGNLELIRNPSYELSSPTTYVSTKSNRTRPDVRDLRPPNKSLTYPHPEKGSEFDADPLEFNERFGTKRTIHRSSPGFEEGCSTPEQPNSPLLLPLHLSSHKKSLFSRGPDSPASNSEQRTINGLMFNGLCRDISNQKKAPLKTPDTSERGSPLLKFQNLRLLEGRKTETTPKSNSPYSTTNPSSFSAAITGNNLIKGSEETAGSNLPQSPRITSGATVNVAGTETSQSNSGLTKGINFAFQSQYNKNHLDRSEKPIHEHITSQEMKDLIAKKIQETDQSCSLINSMVSTESSQIVRSSSFIPIKTDRFKFAHEQKASEPGSPSSKDPDTPSKRISPLLAVQRKLSSLHVEKPNPVAVKEIVEIRPESVAQEKKETTDSQNTTQGETTTFPKIQTTNPESTSVTSDDKPKNAQETVAEKTETKEEKKEETKEEKKGEQKRPVVKRGGRSNSIKLSGAMKLLAKLDDVTTQKRTDFVTEELKPDKKAIGPGTKIKKSKKSQRRSSRESVGKQNELDNNAQLDGNPEKGEDSDSEEENSSIENSPIVRCYSDGAMKKSRHLPKRQ